MKPQRSPFRDNWNEEVSTLIEGLRATGRHQEELMAGEVETVADRQGRTFMLRRAQDRLRHSESAMQAATLNALPAHIAVLDAQGCIVLVNEAWRQFAASNVLQAPGYAVGVNYLAVCERAPGDGADEALKVGAGIRSVLEGNAQAFAIEYACDLPAEQRWFLLTATPLSDAPACGVVVVHANITQRKLGEEARLLEKAMAGVQEQPLRLNDGVLRIASRAGKLTLETQLRQALDNEEFVLHYQPKVNLASGKLTGVEALIRWNDPRTGLVPPARFIPIMEETGLIHEVGRWAMRKAIADHQRWRTAGLAAMRIAVNVSALQMRHPGFLAEISQAIGIDAHAPAGLELEITESLIMRDVKHSIASLQAIRAMGVHIAIDDFGTGFSSLSYLARLPVDTLKIDRSFVIDMTAGMTAGARGMALASGIVTLAHALRLNVVAEGVETEEQSRLLRTLSCDEIQGYLIGKPVPADVFETRFLARKEAPAR